jgi:5,10-methylenetetrahydromethanopterin reductase
MPDSAMNGLQFGLGFGLLPAFHDSQTAAQLEDLARMADDYGVRALATHDTAFLGGDAFVRATLLARASRHCLVGLHPTNPVTREPQVMASFLASLDALSDGRAFLDIGTGDSAVLNIGRRPAKVTTVESYVQCMRSLLRGEDGEFGGRVHRVRWVSPPLRQAIPISMCAEGPRMLDLAGRVGDMVIAGTGLDPAVVSDTRERVAQGAVAAGRSADDVEVWFSCRSVLSEDRDWARNQVKAGASSILNHSMRVGLDGKHVPEELRDSVAAYVQRYELADHVLAKGRNVAAMDECGLTDFALARWGIFGDTDDWIARIAQVAEAGVQRLFLGFGLGDLDRQRHCLKLFGEVILPNFR